MTGNGRDHADLAGWSIFQAAGGPYLGEHALFGGVPTAHYSLQIQMQQRPDGQLVVLYSVWPILMLSSIRAVTLPDDSPCIPLDTLDAEDRARIVSAVAQCEAMIANMAASKAGIVLAPAGTRLPPAPKGAR